MTHTIKPSVFVSRLTQDEYEKQTKKSSIPKQLLDECIAIFTENTGKKNEDK